MIKIVLVDGFPVYTHVACRIALRVAIDEQGSLFRRRQSCGKIYGSGCLADTPFLVRYTYDFAHDLAEHTNGILRRKLWRDVSTKHEFLEGIFALWRKFFINYNSSKITCYRQCQIMTADIF